MLSCRTLMTSIQCLLHFILTLILVNYRFKMITRCEVASQFNNKFNMLAMANILYEYLTGNL